MLTRCSHFFGEGLYVLVGFGESAEKTKMVLVTLEMTLLLYSVRPFKVRHLFD